MYQEINDFIQRYGDDIYRFCRYLTKNQTEAEDLYQEALLRAVEKKEVLLSIFQAAREEEKEDRGALKYLMAIAANLWRNKQRKQMRRRRIAPGDDREDSVLEVTSHVGDPEREYMKKELCEEVRRAVRRLPGKMQVAVYLYYIVQMSTQEIAESLHIPTATVRGRLSRARKIMRRELEEQGYGKF